MSPGEPKIGRFLFDSITKGLYENPLCVFREYIQNAADALDKAIHLGQLKQPEARITITISPSSSSITIEDNGSGLCLEEAPSVLSSVGDSAKFGQRNRGFRGIGRLGGMAYCKRLVFTTKVRGEANETINVWDCQTMADMLNPQNDKFRGSDLNTVIKACSSFQAVASKRKADGFFRIQMEGVSSARNLLTNVEEVRAYLSEVAPVPFDYQKFPFGRELDAELRKEVLNYNTYKLLVNNDEVFKPYKTSLSLGQKKTDVITDVVKIEILDNGGKIVGRGWRAERRDLLGQILRSERVDGIRVRVGNILIGDKDLLDKVFRQERFNGYFVGEVHAIDPGLIPNSRRDDFEHNETSTMFYERLRRDLGDPLSRQVQAKSGENSKIKPVVKAKKLYLELKSTVDDGGFVSTTHKEKAITDLRNSQDQLQGLVGARDPKLRAQAEAQIKKTAALLSKIDERQEDITCSLNSGFSRQERELLGNVFKHIYAIYEKADNPVKLCQLLVQKLNAERK